MLTEEGQERRNVCVPVTMREPDVEEGQGEIEETKDRALTRKGKRQRRRKNS